MTSLDDWIEEERLIGVRLREPWDQSHKRHVFNGRPVCHTRAQLRAESTYVDDLCTRIDAPPVREADERYPLVADLRKAGHCWNAIGIRMNCDPKTAKAIHERGR